MIRKYISKFRNIFLFFVFVISIITLWSDVKGFLVMAQRHIPDDVSPSPFRRPIGPPYTIPVVTPEIDEPPYPPDDFITLTPASGPTLTPTLTPTQTPTPTPCPTKSKGDANCDGKVDGIDYSMWLNRQCAKDNCSEDQLSADFDNDGEVNKDDYDIWFTNSR